MAHRIYYIEDDAGIAEGVAFFLRRKGFEVITAAMVAEGKQLLGKGLPSVVLVDWNLPDGSGEGLCRWIREKWPMLPVIFLTVRGDTRDIVNGFQKGADDYLVKPFELEVLYSRICALLRRAGQAGTGRRPDVSCCTAGRTCAQPSSSSARASPASSWTRRRRGSSRSGTWVV